MDNKIYIFKNKIDMYKDIKVEYLLDCVKTVKY